MRIFRAAAFLLVAAGCGGGVSPTQPTPMPASATRGEGTPTPGFGAVEGRVTDAKTGAALAGVRVDATSGATSFSVTTSTAGAFRMELPPGAARVTASREGYVTYAREHTIEAGPMTLQISLAKIVTPPQPQLTYTLVGLLVDSNRNPIGDAVIRGCCLNDSPIDGTYGEANTDDAGHFRLVTTKSPDSVKVFKRGYPITTAKVATIPAGATANITIVLPRFVRLVLTPVSMNVGQTVHVWGMLETDSGLRLAASFEEVTSSDPSVVAVVSRDSAQGISPGTATLTARDYSGLTATVPATVRP